MSSNHLPHKGVIYILKVQLVLVFFVDLVFELFIQLAYIVQYNRGKVCQYAFVIDVRAFSLDALLTWEVVMLQ
jgi:hypothetical protein